MSALQPTLFQWQEDSNVNPSSELREPAVWLRRLIVLKQWAPGEELCELEFKKGLNIVWAEPHVPETVEEGQNGLSGHAAGKTTLCRFIRYALGESTYGSESFREAFRHKFPKGWLLAEVAVDGTEWLIRRPLGIGAHPAAVEGERIQRAFTADVAWARFVDYLKAVDRAAIRNCDVQSFPDSDRSMAWELVLAWLSRDQDCRMGHLTEWRSRTSESGTPEMSRTEAYWLMKTILGLVSKEDLDAASEQERLRKKQAKLKNDIPMQRYNLQDNADRLHSILDNLGVESSGTSGLPTELEFDRFRRDLKTKREAVELDIDLAAMPEEVRDVEVAYRKSRKDADILEEGLRLEKNKLGRDEHFLDELAGKKKSAEIENWKRERPAPNDRCNVLLSVAREEGCPLAYGTVIDMESHEALKSLPQRMQIMQDAIVRLRAYIAEKEKELHEKNETAEAARLRYDELRQEWSAQNIRAATHRSNLDHALAQLDYCEDISKSLVKCQNELERNVKSLSQLADERAAYRRRVDDQKRELESRFCSILQSVFGIDAIGKIQLEAEGIVPKVECQGIERDSAAMETAKIWAFDLATLLLGVEGKCLHPRFLLHDSPREADLSIDVYHRFFLLLKRATEACEDSQNFQYIVTTTEKPPEELQKKPWLCLHLDASRKEGRLLGVDL